MEQFIIFCFCFYLSLLIVAFIYNCINGIRLNNLNIDKRKKLIEKSEELLKLTTDKINKLSSNMENEEFEIKVTEIRGYQAEIEKVHKEIDKLGSVDEKNLNKINNYNKAIELFLTILSFGIYRKEDI